MYTVHIVPNRKDVSFNMQGIFNCVRYYRKKIFVKGKGPVGLLILKEKYWTINGWGLMWKWKEKYISFLWNFQKIPNSCASFYQCRSSNLQGGISCNFPASPHTAPKIIRISASLSGMYNRCKNFISVCMPDILYGWEWIIVMFNT